MDIRKIDKNFDTTFTAPEDIEWFSARELPFETFGIYYCEEEKRYRRMPAEVAEKVNDGVKFLASNTAGGRLRFATDSPYIVLRCVEEFELVASHMTIEGKAGFSLFSGKKFWGMYTPSVEQIMSGKETGEYVFDGIQWVTEGEKDFTLYFPLYNNVKELYIGLKKGCILKQAKPYTHTCPVLFYGSSITQGGCATKSGDDYINRLSMWLDTDILNLGFSGSALAEKVMVEYLCSLNPSVFVMDYDHNAPNFEHLQKTHYPLYEAFRNTHPDTPIIMMTMPTYSDDSCGIRIGDLQQRYEVIQNTYLRAKENGDNNVYFISGIGLLGTTDGECATVDNCHPNSFGFYLMAKAVYPVLKKLLKGE